MTTISLIPNKKDRPLEIRSSHKAVHNRQFEIQSLHWFKQNRLNIPDEVDTVNLIEILYIVSGDGVILNEKGPIAIQRGSVYVLNERKQGLLHVSENIDGYYISLPCDQFSLMAYESNFSLFLNQSEDGNGTVVVQVAFDSQEDVEEILIRMQREYANFYSLRLEMLMGLYKIFLLYLNRKVCTTGSAMRSRENDLMDKFMKLVSTNFSARKTISYYADELCITPSHLSQVIKRVSGFRPSHWIQQQIIAEAKRRASQSDVSMKEIAFDLGFEDASHFSKFFKNFSGTNFTDFKKEYPAFV